MRQATSDGGWYHLSRLPSSMKHRNLPCKLVPPRYAVSRDDLTDMTRNLSYDVYDDPDTTSIRTYFPVVSQALSNLVRH